MSSSFPLVGEGEKRYTRLPCALRQDALADSGVEMQHGAAVARQRLQVSADRFLVIALGRKKQTNIFMLFQKATICFLPTATNRTQNVSFVLLDCLARNCIFGCGTLHFIDDFLLGMLYLPAPLTYIHPGALNFTLIAVEGRNGDHQANLPGIGDLFALGR